MTLEEHRASVHADNEAAVGGLADLSMSFASTLVHAFGASINSTFRSHPATYWWKLPIPTSSQPPFRGVVRQA
jgi:hypothetical protein